MIFSRALTMGHSDKRLASEIGAYLLFYAQVVCSGMDPDKRRYGGHIEHLMRFKELGEFFRSLTSGAPPAPSIPPIPEPKPGEKDDSALVAFSETYHQTDKQGKKAYDQAVMMRWLNMFDTIRVMICREALRAGLTKTEGQKITQEILIAAANQLTKSEHGLTGEAFKQLLWSYARSHIDRAIHQKANLQPFYASVAWRQKYLSSGLDQT